MPAPSDRTRRSVLRALGLGALATPLAVAAQQAEAPLEPLPLRPPGTPFAPRPDAPPRTLLRPPRLRPNATIGLVAPAGRMDRTTQITGTQEELARLGFRTKVGRHVMDRHGYLAGTDTDRAADLMAMFTDPEVDAIIAMRGGWGCARMLPLLDYDVIRANPKILIGYSDITALLLAIYAKSGLVTFHGPVGRSTWNEPTVASFLGVLSEGERLRIDPQPDNEAEADLIGRQPQAYRPIRAGIAEGPLIGGNLSVISALAGTPYLPDFAKHVVFFEETNESLYRIDRMLTQLRLAGSFDDLAAFVFGQCRRCDADELGRDGLAWLLRDQFAALGYPSWTGAPIGHVTPVYTLPIGVPVITDAAMGTLMALESAVA